MFFGGSVPTNQTQRALDGIDSLLRPDVQVDVVVGSANPHRNEISSFCSMRRWANYHCQVSNMAEIISSADLAVGAGGAAMWERCVLGLPTLTVVFADNQVKTTEDVAETGAIEYLGWATNLTSADYAEAIRALFDKPGYLEFMSKQALKLMGASNSGTQLIVNAMNESINTVASFNG